MKWKVCLLSLFLLAASLVRVHDLGEASPGELLFEGFPGKINAQDGEITLSGRLTFHPKEHSQALIVQLWVEEHEGRIKPSYIPELREGKEASITVYLSGKEGKAILLADASNCPSGSFYIEVVPAEPTFTPIPFVPTPTFTPTEPIPTETIVPTPTGSETPTPTPTVSETEAPPAVTPTPSPKHQEVGNILTCLRCGWQEGWVDVFRKAPEWKKWTSTGVLKDFGPVKIDGLPVASRFRAEGEEYKVASVCPDEVKEEIVRVWTNTDSATTWACEPKPDQIKPLPPESLRLPVTGGVSSTWFELYSRH